MCTCIHVRVNIKFYTNNVLYIHTYVKSQCCTVGVLCVKVYPEHVKYLELQNLLLAIKISLKMLCSRL